MSLITMFVTPLLAIGPPRRDIPLKTAEAPIDRMIGTKGESLNFVVDLDGFAPVIFRAVFDSGRHVVHFIRFLKSPRGAQALTLRGHRKAAGQSKHTRIL